MEWGKLLSSKRLNVVESVNELDTRSPYLIDVDRLIYSAHFRKLQDKTQVHPLSQSDFVRTRLTHSLEVATVARSLGYNVGIYILKNNPNLKLTEHDFGYIVQAASLAHDIGNPPFGHLGEDAIKDFFKNYFGNLENNSKKNFSESEIKDLENFDGNSQGFRIITNLAGWKAEGGLRLTYATLGAFLKYPRAYAKDIELKSIYQNNKESLVADFNYKSILVGHKKIGILNTELEKFKEIATELGLIKLSNNSEVYYRHPLSFLTEAADDICYSVADIEDAFFVGLIKLEDVENLLIPIVKRSSKYSLSKEEKLNNLRNESFYKNMDLRKKVEFLRGKAINNLTAATVECFIKYEKDILQGKFNNDLLNLTEFAEDIKNCKKFVRDFVFKSHKKINAEISGITIIYETINELTNLIFKPESRKSLLIFNYLEKNFILDNAEKIFNNTNLSNYNKFVIINDIISDFTDKNIIQFYKILKGL
jgi:dGTPase